MFKLLNKTPIYKFNKSYFFNLSENLAKKLKLQSIFLKEKNSIC